MKLLALVLFLAFGATAYAASCGENDGDSAACAAADSAKAKSGERSASDQPGKPSDAPAGSAPAPRRVPRHHAFTFM